MTIAIAPQDLLLYAAVVREGSFTRAARALGLTKQTVSERIAKLEAKLGVRLLERTTRRLRVTDAGARYYERCSAIAAQIDEANSEVQQEQAEPVGLLRVSAPVLYGRRFLAPVVADYMRRHPGIRVELVLGDRRINLVEEGIDLAIRIGALDDSSLTSKKIGEGHIYYVASPEFLKTQGTPKPHALRDTRCIGMRLFETWEVGGKPQKITPVLTVNDLETACDAAVAGVGVARLPGLVCREPVARGRLTLLFRREPTLLRPVYVVYPSRAYLPAKVRRFIETLTSSSLVEPMRPLPATGARSATAARSR